MKKSRIYEVSFIVDKLTGHPIKPFSLDAEVETTPNIKDASPYFEWEKTELVVDLAILGNQYEVRTGVVGIAIEQNGIIELAVNLLNSLKTIMARFVSTEEAYVSRETDNTYKHAMNLLVRKEDNNFEITRSEVVDVTEPDSDWPF